MMLRKLPDEMGKVTGADPFVKRMRMRTSHKGWNTFSMGGINGKLFFLFLIVYHIAITFQGIDLLDEGFHAVFYQRIFDDPLSVQYSFFYWFSGIVGGSILKIAPGLGLWGLRLAGALVSCTTIFLVYRLMRNFIPRGILQAGIVILALYINTEPKDIHYNTLSAFLFFAAAVLMFNGLARNNRYLVFLSGSIVGLNVFTRLPNLLGITIGLAIIYDGYIMNRSRNEIFLGLAGFINGFIVSAALVFLFMSLSGHLDIFLDSVKFLFSLTTTTGEQDGLEGSYGIGRLVYVLVKQHSISILLIILLSALVILYKFVADASVVIGKVKFRTDMVLFVLISISAFWLIMSGRIDIQYLTYLFTGISVITALIYILGNYSREEKLLSLLGLLIMAVHPFGSAPGIMTVMIYSLWINFPMAIAMLYKLVRKDCEFHFRIGRESYDLFVYHNTYLKRIMQWLGIFILVICLHHLFVFPYFYDKHNRTEMVHGIENANMKYIFTSAGRAKELNELLAASDKYIPKGESVLAYDAIPLFHFMTETKPFLPNTTPMFYTNQQFTAELKGAVEEGGLPVIVQQKIWMIHDGSGWPEDIKANNNPEETLNNRRNIAFNDFLKTYNYHEVWANDIFRILLSTAKGKTLQNGKD